jgi:hypothetical protein
MQSFSLLTPAPGKRHAHPGGGQVTSVGDIEIELVFRVAVRGRARDLALLMSTLEGPHIAILQAVKDDSTPDQTASKPVVVNIGSFQP